MNFLVLHRCVVQCIVMMFIILFSPLSHIQGPTNHRSNNMYDSYNFSSNMLLFYIEIKRDKNTLAYAKTWFHRYSLDHNILELYNVTTQTRLTTSKTKRDI